MAERRIMMTMWNVKHMKVKNHKELCVLKVMHAVVATIHSLTVVNLISGHGSPYIHVHVHAPHVILYCA